MSAPREAGNAVTWHDVECGAYAADLPLWHELARERANGSPVLELGCGTGRVALDLAIEGHAVRGLDHNRTLVAELNRRARERELDASAAEGDLVALAPGTQASLILAPMQVIQLLAGSRDRLRALTSARDSLSPSGRLALAIVEGDAPGGGHTGEPPVPDVAEHDGWVYSSLPLETHAGDGVLRVRRLRQTVSPDGRLTEELDTTTLAILDCDSLAREARAAGFEPIARREIPATDEHIGSTVLVLEAA